LGSYSSNSSLLHQSNSRRATTMTSAAKRKSTGPLSKELVEGFPDPGTFEDIPRVRQIAGPSVGQRMKGKVAIVTGKRLPPRPMQPRLR
jgi:hypothetical protein